MVGAPDATNPEVQVQFLRGPRLFFRWRIGSAPALTGARPWEENPGSLTLFLHSGILPECHFAESGAAGIISARLDRLDFPVVPE